MKYDILVQDCRWGGSDGMTLVTILGQYYSISILVNSSGLISCKSLFFNSTRFEEYGIDDGDEMVSNIYHPWPWLTNMTMFSW